MNKGTTIAIIGASTNRDKFGNKAVRAYVKQGYTVYPVTPSADEVEGLKAYKSIRDIPGEVELASLYVPPPVGLKVLGEIAEKKVREVYVNPGAESDELIEKARELGLRAIVACSILAIGMTPEEV
ncbi:MAG: CoA-binding protein [Candidatus Latescibacterota bacterium]|nr:MAG: CoA-binding protein [Candidatus Latescibacterota bacterium]